MMDTKVTTVIVNSTKHGLTMKVGNRQCYAKLTSFKVGGEYKMQLDVNWTYQEFLVQDKFHSRNRVFINSDDCCNYERITIMETADGRFDMQRELREQFRTSCTPIEDEISSGLTPSTWNSWLCKFIHV
ncbi:hypothetical protein KC19_8G132500 [Ceratodon purpureus]|uniref:DUF7748 domain-containing protein n=1 Tax=Ceratodon purpureus TaxID=3225 RepID=A0A8T0GYE4_CERPU|nr:hypothetical protein KC19_8G132500 [Ceratodon purpureus]